MASAVDSRDCEVPNSEVEGAPTSVTNVVDDHDDSVPEDPGKSEEPIPIETQSTSGSDGDVGATPKGRTRRTRCGRKRNKPEAVELPATLAGTQHRKAHASSNGGIVVWPGPSSRSVFVGAPVSVEIVENRAGLIVPPFEWYNDSRLGLMWPTPGPYEEVDLRRHNLKARRADDYAWDFTAISNIQIRVVERTIRELIKIDWGSQWVPLNWVTIDTPELKKQFEDRKAVWLGKARTDRELKTYLRGTDLELLTVQSTHEVSQKAKLVRIDKFATFESDAKEIEIVLATFKESYEHCSCLVDHPLAWVDVLTARKAAIERDPHYETNPLLREARGKCDEHLRFL